MNTIFKIGIAISLSALFSCSSGKKLNNDIKDGSTIEKAILVSNVDEEYEYVRKVCVNCLFVSQSLITKDEKSYDLLNFKTPEGKSESYYFDITSFH